MPVVNINSAEIVAYARIEPRALARDYRATVKAAVHDALWMLTQQWRVGEFRGEDAGTLVKARVQTQSTKINRFASRMEASVEAFDGNTPLEAKIERLPLKSDLALQLELGNNWFKLIAQDYSSQMNSLFSSFRSAFPIEQINANSGPERNSNKDALRIRTLVSSRSMDGYKLYEYFVNGGNATDIAPGYPGLSVLQSRFLDWINNTYYTPDQTSGVSWSPEILEYQSSVSVPLGTSPTADQYVLRADRYKRGDLDWYSFDLDADSGSRLTESGTPADNNAAVLPPATFSYIPQTIEFKGMPKDRWWAFEDRNNDLSKMLTQRQDISKMVIMEFGLIYSNDWFLIPHVVPDGSVNDVKALVTTDVFGRHFLIKRSGSGLDEQWQRWDMFNITRQGAAEEETFGKLLMILNVKACMESEAIEKVMFLRDEMANMIWGVEEVVPNELMGGMDGKNANNELQKYLAEKSGVPQNPTGYEPNEALHRFTISNSVPENWIPFVATKQTPALHGGRDVMVQRAVMRRYINDNYTDDLIRPRTDILSVGISNDDPYFINEEVVSRSGMVVSTNFQRVRWYDGKTFTWLGRKVSAGNGGGNSGLKFDILQDKESDEGIVDIPLAGMKGWWKADAAGNEINSGRVVRLIDNSANGLDLSVWNGVPGPQLVEVHGIPSLSFNNNILLSTIGSEPISGYQDFTIFYVGDSIIGRGFDDVPTDNYWSFIVRTADVNIVLVNQGHINYGINLHADNQIRIVGVALEQRDPGIFPFAARLTAYNNAGEITSVPNNPLVIPLNNYLRNANNIGMTMGAAGASGGFLNGHTFETIVYDRKLSDSEIARVMSYLNRKYPFAVGIPFAGMKGWWKADAAENELSSGRVVKLKDNSSNGLDLSVWGSIPGPELIYVNGVRALSFNNTIS
jgi:hypothetical protein